MIVHGSFKLFKHLEMTDNTTTYGRTDLAVRGAVLALKATTGLSSTAIAELIAGVSTRQVNRIYSRAIKAGFEPSARPLQITNAIVADRPKSGRPRKHPKEAQNA